MTTSWAQARAGAAVTPADAIGVLTFHDSINYGSYWQARCLVEGLQARGRPVVLLDHHSTAVRSAELRSAFQPDLPARTPRRHHPALGRKVRAFASAVAALPRSAAFPLDAPAEAPPVDTVVVGSDEVWNFAHPWYAARPIFFGEGLRARRLVSYAASFGNHDGGLDADWSARLRRFDAISVRDENSRAMVAAALGVEPAMVLDPCLQFPSVLPPAPERPGDYVVLYGHGLPDWFVRAVRRWAEGAGVQVVAVGYPSPVADRDRSDAGPLEFATLMAGARAVATSFFHGAVFALHYGKPFVAAASPYRRIKLEGLTDALAARHRLIDEATDDATIRDLLATPVEAETLARLAAGREVGTRYLDRALG
ncbi:polysaccharide pyruvyl transferase family protein [Sphingomonas sp. KR1UV-12]|uniref:Polysaccharide pyruvyl transferase family protein n=1 Tax=Sphingomonas aurea TaxID=3063994 RepID=A0ABT9ELJ3_9SPHN|nr:polysaccharide pyruvyl transferase family protein [Sphingomonas sp. KR1UV-12]MDP1027725.1 polysaccharide pyruvyl transferase family protein [Sphingomonas sp. KR1UV-12]